MLNPDRRVGNLSSVGTVARRELKYRLLGGSRVVVSNGLETAAVQQGNEEHRETTAQGTSLTVSVAAGWNTPWLREIIHHGRVFAPRVDDPRSDYPVISAYLLLEPNEDWAKYLDEDKAPPGSSFYEDPEVIPNEIATDSGNTGVGGPAALVAHMVGAGSAAAVVSRGGSRWGLKFLYLFSVGMGFWALEEAGVPITSTSINWGKNQNHEASSWAKDGLVNHLVEPIIWVAIFLGGESIAFTLMKFTVDEGQHKREVELISLRLQNETSSVSKRSSSKTSTSSRKSRDSAPSNRSDGKDNFPCGLFNSAGTILCQAGSIYRLNNPRRRLIPYECLLPSGCAITMTPPDRNYATKDSPGDPFQADV